MSMALAWRTFASIERPTASSKLSTVNDLRRPHISSVHGDGNGRRGLLAFILLSAATDSKTALLQEYQKRSKENKAKNDKERLDDYYRRNYKDYFEFVEGSSQDKTEEQLSESEKGIREWLQKNKKR